MQVLKNGTGKRKRQDVRSQFISMISERLKCSVYVRDTPELSDDVTQRDMIFTKENNP